MDTTSKVPRPEVKMVIMMNIILIKIVTKPLLAVPHKSHPLILKEINQTPQTPQPPMMDMASVIRLMTC